MLSFDEIKKDLDETQKCIDTALLSKHDGDALPYADKMMKLVVWFMQHGYVE